MRNIKSTLEPFLIKLSSVNYTPLVVSQLRTLCFVKLKPLLPIPCPQPLAPSLLLSGRVTAATPGTS